MPNVAPRVDGLMGESVLSFRDVLGDRFADANAAARAGEYQLVLGAGASLGAESGSGEPLPKASDLVLRLQKAFPQAPISESTSLQRAYQRAVSVSSQNYVWETLKRIFGGSTHEAWFDQLSGFPWRRVWTLNVDDTFENSYARTLRSGVMGIRTIDWTDPFSERSDLEVVHLHGQIIGTKPSPLVFSFSEYQAAAQVRPVWDQVLAGSMSTKPFVVIGARLLDDSDIEALVLANPPKHAAPSFIVDPFIDAGNKWELENLGYVVVETAGEHFVKDWAQAFGLADTDLELLYSSSTVDIPQFVKLETNRVRPAPRSHDFLGGSEPLWSDACDRRIASLHWMEAIAGTIDSWAQQSLRKPTVHVLYGERLIGMSSGLYEIARIVRAKSVEVVMFDRSTRFNVERVLDFCRGRGPVLLLVDGVHEFAQDIDRLADRAQDDPAVELYALIADRPNRDLKIENQLVGRYIRKGDRVRPRMSKADARVIVGTLSAFGRLGALESLDSGGRLAHFANRDVFSAMAEVEFGIGFRARLLKEVEQLREEWHRDLLFLLSMASVDNNQVGVQEASFALGVSSARILGAITSDNHLSAVIEVVGDLLLPRQRDRGIAALMEGRDESHYLARLAEMIRGLARLTTNQSLRERNRAAVLVGRLMNAKVLAKLFPTSNIDGFYEGLRNTFGDWNARYWEQRAINSKLAEDWAPAESFAARAVSLYDDAYTRTTYGTILINKATHLAASSELAWAGYYRRGKDELDVAMGKDRRNRVTAFAYLESTLSLLGKLMTTPSIVQAEDGSLSTVHKEWMAGFAEMRIGLSSDQGFESGSRAQDLLQRYEKLTGGVPR